MNRIGGITMYDDYPNYEKFKKKAESTIGKWYTDKESNTTRENCVYYIYDVDFDTQGNDWQLLLYQIDPVFMTITQDYIYLEDFPDEFKRINRDSALDKYHAVTQSLEDMFKNGPKRD